MRFIFKKISNSSLRTKNIIYNILGSFFFKGFSIVASLLIIPLTIDYLDPVRYGIWLTISTLITWITYFDMGLANGFRNRFAEAKAKKDIMLARKYVSTSYFLITLIMLIVYLCVIVIAPLINWADVLNISQQYNNELKKVILILSAVLCMSLIVNIFQKLVLADQRPALNSCIVVIGQGGALISIYLLKTYNYTASLVDMALYYSSIPPLMVFITSILLFNFSHYKKYRPSLRYVDIRLWRNIIGIGISFFIIQISLLVIIQLINLILSRNVGPLAVTQYNVTYKYFSILLMVTTIIATPFWSAFTDAYTKKDINWMHITLRWLDRYSFFVAFGGIVLLILSSFFYKIWLKGEIIIDYTISLSVMAFCVIQTIGFIYMTIINGIGKIRLQLLIFLAFSLFSFPIMSLLAKYFSIPGVLIVPALVYLFQAIILRIQILKILKGNSTGIWNI